MAKDCVAPENHQLRDEIRGMVSCYLWHFLFMCLDYNYYNCNNNDDNSNNNRLIWHTES